MNKSYPWWTRLPIIGRIFFAGWGYGEESGIARGWVQATGKDRPAWRGESYDKH